MKRSFGAGAPQPLLCSGIAIIQPFQSFESSSLQKQQTSMYNNRSLLQTLQQQGVLAC